jgi:hypothetical protein
MSNPPKKKGTAYEKHVLERYLQHIWATADRAALHGTEDIGDFTGCGRWVIEAKAQERLALPEWIEKTTAKARKMGYHWMVVFKRDKRGALRKDYVVVDADTFFDMLGQLDYTWRR